VPSCDLESSIDDFWLVRRALCVVCRTIADVSLSAKVLRVFLVRISEEEVRRSEEACFFSTLILPLARTRHLKSSGESNVPRFIETSSSY
jgi:hypothetical protein